MKSDMARRVDAALRTHLAPVLRHDGFRGSGRNFRCVRGELIHVLNVQGSKYGEEFAVNLGVHLAFLPDLLGKPVTWSKLTEPDCEFRRRMTAGGGAYDQWWSHGDDETSIEAAVRSAVAVYLANGRGQLEALGAYPDSFAHVTADSLASGTAELGGFRPYHTLVRMALVFARIRVHEDALSAAREFAELGLQNGAAGALRRELEAIRDVS